MILVDTGPLVAAGNRADAYHAKCVRTLASAEPPRLVPATVVAETGYLLERAAGSAVETEFLRLFSSGCRSRREFNSTGDAQYSTEIQQRPHRLMSLT